MPSKCFVGRIIFRTESIDDLDWQSPCPIPAEMMLPFEPPMYLCTVHFDPLCEVLYDRLVSMGYIPPGILGGPGALAEDAWPSGD